jgi:hypothetical protein
MFEEERATWLKMATTDALGQANNIGRMPDVCL